MSDKEVIMVNDVDVSGCEYYGNGGCLCSGANTYGAFCNNNPDCYFKQKVRTEQQLEAKEKEIEELKGKLKVAAEEFKNIRKTKTVEVCQLIAYQALKQIESEA